MVAIREAGSIGSSPRADRPNGVTRWHSLPYTLSWASVTGSATKDRVGRRVRLYAWAGYGGTGSVSYGRVKVTYGVLK